MIGLEKGRGGLSLANDGMGICSVKIRVPFFLESGVNTRYRTSAARIHQKNKKAATWTRTP